MRSIVFPKMFTGNSTNVYKADEYLKSTKQNTLLLLSCEKGELFGDPYYGIRLKKHLFEPNDYILKDVLIDEIYTQLALFIPQVKFDRNDITITQRGSELYCNIKGINQIDFTTNMFNLVLTTEEAE